MAVEHEDSGPGVPEWVVTFGDMMSLLLTFFIMLFSMSEIKQEQRYQAMVEALHRQFGHDTSTASVMPGESRPRNSQIAKMASMGRARRMDTLNGGDRVKAPVGDHPRVQSIAHADQTTVGGTVYFDQGKAEITPAGERIIQQAAQQLAGKPQKIEVRGHTSSEPLAVNSPYKDHWTLAYARCRNVADALVKLGIDARRIRMAVAGDNEPKHISNDPILQNENNRVVISSLNEFVEDLEGTPEERKHQFSREPSGVPP